jgi:glutathione peroxidase
MKTVYDYSVKNYKGEEVQLTDFKGKVLVIVNTASKCGFTGQYAQLQELYDTYNEKGLEIIAFPCNQFGEQEKGTDEEIHSFCQMNYGLSFPVFSKVDVNGENEHPLYTHLKNEKKGLLGKDIKWNFTKFIINRDGEVVKRVAPQTNPLKMSKEIEQLLG